MSTAAPPTPFLLPAASLARREVVRFLRQRSRVIGALATPLLFWLVIGSGLGKSFRPPNVDASQNFLTYFFPGTIMLVVLFTAIFSCISIIEDRREGFLQSVLVAPVSPTVIVAGKVLGCTALALIQALPMLLIAPLLGLKLSIGGLLSSLAILTVTSLGVGAIGFVFAWRLNSVQGFHSIMNLLLMPMWMLSGAFFPAAGAAPWTAAVMAFNPLTYATAALRMAIDPSAAQTVGELPGIGLCWAVLSVTVAASLFLAARAVATTSERPPK